MGTEVKIFKAPGNISKITTMASTNTLRLQVDCQELSANEEAIVFSARNKFGWFLFAEGEKSGDEFDNIELPKITLEPDEKSPATRLRAVLYRLWEESGKRDERGQECASETFYKIYMEKYIDHCKKKLNDLTT